jgi:hypothetical protein
MPNAFASLLSEIVSLCPLWSSYTGDGPFGQNAAEYRKIIFGGGQIVDIADDEALGSDKGIESIVGPVCLIALQCAASAPYPKNIVLAQAG